jgi:acetyl esterase/lipase
MRQAVGRWARGIQVILAGFLITVSPARSDESVKKTKTTEEPPKKAYKVKVTKDVEYYDGADKDKVKHKLDLYLPEGVKDYPVLFFVHGGAWVFGDRGDLFGMLYGGLAKVYAKQGIGVVVISYRLSPKVKHPEHVKDVARAFAWTSRNIGKYGGDARKIFVSGHSAGAHLVSLLTTDETYLKAHKLTAKDIRGVIPISGVYRVPDNFLPKVFGDSKDAGKNASPITYARGKLPPFLILYADGDLPGCGKPTSEAFRKALEDKGTKAATLEITKSNHTNILFDAGKANTKVSNAIVEFIRK